MSYTPKPGEVFYFAVPMSARHVDIDGALAHIAERFSVVGSPVLCGTYDTQQPAYRLYSIKATS